MDEQPKERRYKDPLDQRYDEGWKAGFLEGLEQGISAASKGRVRLVRKMYAKPGSFAADFDYYLEGDEPEVAL